MLRGETRKALEIFERVALPEARFNHAVALLKLGANAQAATEFDKIAADAQSTLRASAGYHAALALDRLGRTPEAEKALEKALTVDAKFDAARLYLGVLRERRGNFEGAAKAYLEFLKTNPDSLSAMLRLGTVAARAGRTDVARAWLRKVVATAPDSPEAVEARKLLVMWE